MTRTRRRTAGRAGGEDVVVEAAWLYYHDGLNQNEIAARLGVSRATVVNYLQSARESGLVRITLAEHAFSGHRLAIEARETFGLAEVHVVAEGADEQATLRRVARAAAAWLPALLQPGDRLGVSWGQTVYEVAEALDPVVLDDLTVLQLVGSMATPYGFSAEACSTLLAERLGARCLNLHTPAVLSNAELAALLRAEPLIASQFDALATINKSIFAAGSSTAQSHVVGSGVASLSDLEVYKAAGAVGVMCGRFIDAEGGAVDGPLNARMMGVELDRLRRPELGLLVSCGADKVAPMLAAIRGGYATHMVTSHATAEAMLHGATAATSTR